ncbi:MAG: antiterminator LoaP [Clostridiaceae bacterium]|nr:antiterminator LoaP [Clostridiaceae bacterium]
MYKGSAWYALFVKTGEENLVKERLDYRFGGDPVIMIPKKIIKERKNGKWYQRVRNLFPGYIFLHGTLTNENYRNLWQVPGLYKLLCTDREPVRIPDSEIEVFSHLFDREDIIQESDILMEGEEVTIVSGPLTALQGKILKVDKRKGRARVMINFLGEERIIDLGVNIIQAANNQ